MAFVLLIPSARRKTQWNLYLTRRNEICTPLNRPDFSPNLSGKRGKAFRFTNAWEQRKLGAIVQITMGQSPDGSTYSDTPADYILVQGNADLKNGWVCPRVWTTQKTKFATAGDLIMSVRAPAGSVGKTAYDVVLGRGVASLKGNEFIYQSLVKMDFDGYWKAESTGSTFESLSSDSISTAELYCPSEDEQHKIGIFLSRLDSLLTLHQRQQNGGYLWLENSAKQVCFAIITASGYRSTKKALSDQLR
ncbi:restriction endonuclease subunit S [Mesosutterella multiformis]|uniref:restriction endonuclease subunit S n=1 Tax=Mesosutterella multiformis TaxID=2259133 RepID=UPI00190F2795|nr:restriction endonuclease subunit S [Mesosutterella multiformis]